MKPRYYLASVMLVLIPISCTRERTNAPQKVRNSVLTRCETMAQCERVANG